MECRGHKTRQRIVDEYEVNPVLHAKLLANQRKISDAKATIEDEYYIFVAKNKKDKHWEKIQCGMGAAKDFLSILNHPGLPLFDPLNELRLNTSKEKSYQLKRNMKDHWNGTAKQLYNAIIWLIIAYEIVPKPGKPLYDVKEEIIRCKGNNPDDSQIKSINTLIKIWGKGQSLTEIVNNKFRKENDIKDSMCDFSLLHDRIKMMKDKNGNKIESFF